VADARAVTDVAAVAVASVEEAVVASVAEAAVTVATDHHVNNKPQPSDHQSLSEVGSEIVFVFTSNFHS